jgi:hypothetical protein
VGFVKRVIRVESVGPEEDVNCEKMQGKAVRWRWVQERGGGNRKQVDCVATLVRAGDSTVQYSTRFHLSHVESAIVSASITHGHTRGLIVEREFSMNAEWKQCSNTCTKELSDFKNKNFECCRKRLEKVELLKKKIKKIGSCCT